MLDWDRFVDLGTSLSGERIVPFITTELLISSLDINREPSVGFSEVEVRIRDLFDGFLTELEMLNSYVEADLIKDHDILPFLGYWIRAMKGQGGYERPGFPESLSKYLKIYGYQGVIDLLSRSPH
jgi:hypothetical protein